MDVRHLCVRRFGETPQRAGIFRECHGTMADVLIMLLLDNVICANSLINGRGANHGVGAQLPQ